MKSIDLKTQKLCVISGLLWGTLFFVALYMAGQFPPISPHLTGEGILAIIHSHPVLVKASIPVGILSAGLALPFNALIAGHIARIEIKNESMPLLTITSFLGGMGNIMLFYMIFLWWAGIFYRPDTTADVAIMVNDRVWILMVSAFSAPALQMVCIAMSGFRDQSSQPVFPRWYCFFMLWIALGTCTGSIAIFFYDGPFAWNGIIGFWIPAIAYSVWLISLCYFYYRFTLTQAES